MSKILFFLLLLWMIPAYASVDFDNASALYQKSCASCHGADGNSPIALFPKLAGQHANYLRKELRDYQQGVQGGRNNPIMVPIVAKLSAQDSENLIVFLSRQPTTNGATQPALLQRGRQLFMAGDRILNIPACASCHSPDGSGNGQAKYPALAGQNEAYIVQQLKAFQEGIRFNDPHTMMQTIASRLSPQDKQAVASYINGLRPGR